MSSLPFFPTHLGPLFRWETCIFPPTPPAVLMAPNLSQPPWDTFYRGFSPVGGGRRPSYQKGKDKEKKKNLTLGDFRLCRDHHPKRNLTKLKLEAGIPHGSHRLVHTAIFWHFGGLIIVSGWFVCVWVHGCVSVFPSPKDKDRSRRFCFLLLSFFNFYLRV